MQIRSKKFTQQLQILTYKKICITDYIAPILFVLVANKYTTIVLFIANIANFCDFPLSIFLVNTVTYLEIVNKFFVS